MGEAEYRHENAKDRDAYESTIAELQRVQAQYDALMEKQAAAQDVIDSLGGERAALEDAYKDAKKAREDQAQFLKDEADLDVAPFDPEQGPPELPEEP